MEKVESLLIIGGSFLGSELAVGLASRGRSCELSAVTMATSAVTTATSAVTMTTRAPQLGIVFVPSV